MLLAFYNFGKGARKNLELWAFGSHLDLLSYMVRYNDVLEIVEHFDGDLGAAEWRSLGQHLQGQWAEEQR